MTAEPAVITVVVIEDHTMVAEGVAASLNATADMRVVAIAGTGDEGLAQVRRHQPTVLLLDQSLPDGLGTDLMPALHKASPGTRVLLVTAADTDDVLLRAVQSGCVGFVTKGRRAAALLDAVRRAAAGETVLQPADLSRLMPAIIHQQMRLGDSLSAREHQVLSLLANGRSTTSMAGDLLISSATARNHIQAVIRKLGAHSKLEAVSIALREGIVASP